MQLSIFQTFELTYDKTINIIYIIRNQSKHLKQRGITKNLGIKGVSSGLKIQTFFFCLRNKVRS